MSRVNSALGGGSALALAVSKNRAVRERLRSKRSLPAQRGNASVAGQSQYSVEARGGAGSSAGSAEGTLPLSPYIDDNTKRAFEAPICRESRNMTTERLPPSRNLRDCLNSLRKGPLSWMCVLVAGFALGGLGAIGPATPVSGADAKSTLEPARPFF